jgi:hypothetical protein
MIILSQILSKFSNNLFDMLKHLGKFLSKVHWKVWLVLGIILLIVLGFLFIREQRIKAAEKERELLREIARIQGQVDLGEGVIYSSGIKIDNLLRRLDTLHGENSNLRGKIDTRIEVPVISIQTEIRYRDRLVYIYSPENPQDSATTTIVEIPDDNGGTLTNAIVEFDITRRPFRVFGRTESIGPQVELELEQVEPFVLGIVLTRERRSQEWNLFVEDQSEMLEINIGHFVVDDQSLTKPRLGERLGVGSSLNIGQSSSSLGVHGSVDVGPRTTVWGGPTMFVPHTEENMNFGVGVGFTTRPFIRNR